MMVKVHKFDTWQQATAAVEQINEGEGIPISPEATTQTYCNVEQYDEFYYIRFDEVTAKYIDHSTEIEILEDQEI